MPPTRKTPTGSGKKRYSKSGSGKPRKKVVKMRVGFVLATALALLLSLILSRCSGRRTPPNPGENPAGNWRYGIDISHNNDGTIIWDSLWVMTDRRRRTVRDPYKAKEIKPVSFVFIKATEGATFKDRDFAENWKNAGHPDCAGEPTTFRSSKDGEVQAKHFIATVGDLRFGSLLRAGYRDPPPRRKSKTLE